MADDANKVTMGDLRTIIKDMVTEVVGTGKKETTDGVSGTAPKQAPETTENRSVGVAAMVKAEIDKLKAQEQEESEKATIQDKLKELSDKTAEKQPIERRRVHKMMGWGENG